MNKESLGCADVAHMAELSRLRVSAEEQALFQTQFADILGYMDVLQKVDVTGVEPLYSPCTHHCVPRKDLCEQKRTHAEILSNAPLADADYFMVPRIV